MTSPKEQVKSEFGQVLEELLGEQKDITKTSLATRVGLRPSQLSQYVSGYRKVPLQVVESVAEELELDDWRKEKLLRTAGIPDKLPTHTRGGITYVHPGLPTDDFSRWIGKAQEVIQIQETWIAGSPSAAFARGIHTLIDRQKEMGRKVPIQILLLDYREGTRVALQRGRDIQLVDEKTAVRNIMGNLWDLDTLRNDLDIEVKLYKNLPSFAVYRCDNQALIGFFTHGNVSEVSPYLEVNYSDTLFGKMIKRDFNTLWVKAREVRWDDDPDIEQGRTVLNKMLSYNKD